jgi:hypothetical protein
MQRLTEIALERSRGRVFTRMEVAAWAQGTNDAEYALIKRAVAAGEVIRIHRGIYCLANRYRTLPIDSFSLAQRIVGPSYVSLEMALAFHGWIPEAVDTVTSVCGERSRAFNTPLGRFSFSRVPQAMLFEEVIRVERQPGEFSFVATPLKALADYVCVRRCMWTTMEPLVESMRIEPELIAGIDPAAFDTLMDNYRSRRVRNFLSGLRREVYACRSA